MKKLLTLFLSLLCCQLIAQKIFIPYRDGKLWGLADTFGKLVLKPAYDKIEYDEFYNYSLKNIYFFTTLKQRKGVLMNNKEIIAPAYEHIGQGQAYFLCKEAVSQQVTLYNVNGKKLNDTAFKEINLIYHNDDNSVYPTFIVRTAESQYSLGYIDGPNAKLVFLVKNAFSISKEETLLVQKHKDSTAIIYDIVLKQGRLILVQKKQDADNMNGQTVEGEPLDGNGYTVEVSPPEEQGNGSYTYRFSKQQDTWTNKYSQKDKSKPEFVVDKSLYDSVYPYKNNDYQTFSFADSSGKYTYIDNLLLTEKNGLTGALFPDGRMIQNSYQLLQPLEYKGQNILLNRSQQIYFKVKQHGKFGIINQFEKTIIPTEYDGIDANLIVRKNGKFGVLTFKDSVLLPIVFDSIEWTNNCYITKAKGKYGLLTFNSQDNKPLSFDCMSPLPASGFKRFRTNSPKYLPYIVLILKNSDGTLLGYFDKKGIAYYR